MCKNPMRKIVEEIWR